MFQPASKVLPYKLHFSFWKTYTIEIRHSQHAFRISENVIFPVQNVLQFLYKIKVLNTVEV